MAPRSNPTQTEQRLTQIEQDLARFLLLAAPHTGAQRELEVMAARYALNGQETRPYSAPEQREAVSA